MKKRLAAWLFSLLLCLNPLGLNALCDQEAPAKQPGLSRTYIPYPGYDTVSNIAARYGVEPTKLTGMWPAYGLGSGPIPFYSPFDPQPLTLYIALADDFWVLPERQINEDNMYAVSYSDWTRSIESESKGLLIFTDDPDLADILLVVDRYYPFYANYLWRNVVTVPGYACKIGMGAFLLADPDERCIVQRQSTPGKQVTTTQHYESGFYMDSPTFFDSAQIKELVESILSWYGCGTTLGSEGKGVRLLQKALTERGYLAEKTEPIFDTDMEAAVKDLQKDYGLEQTGVINRSTLLAVFYNQDAVNEMLTAYPDEK